MASDANAYKLPNDTQEHARLNSQHAALRFQAGKLSESSTRNHRLLTELGSNYFAPIRTPEYHTIVDLCCGGGQWIMEMASEFPEAKLYGVDLNPPEMSTAPPNCTFVKSNLLISPLPFESESVSFVQLRTVPTIIGADRERLISEIARVLHKGGILQMVEPLETYSLDAGGYGHRSPRLIEVDSYLVQLPHLHSSAAGSGVSTDWSIAPRLRSMMLDHGPGTFSDVQQKSVVLPVGNWPEDPTQREIGNLIANVYIGMLKGFREALLGQGLISETAFQELVENTEKEIRGKEGREWKLCFEFIYVWGMKSS